METGAAFQKLKKGDETQTLNFVFMITDRIEHRSLGLLFFYYE